MAKHAVRMVKFSLVERARIARLAKFRTGTLALSARHQSVTSVKQDGMTMTLILLLHARAAVRVSTLQRGRHHAVTVRLGT